MKKLLVLALGMVFLLGAGGLLFAQPEAFGYTISDIYYYLAEGTEPTWGNHSMEPQSGVPGQDIEGFSKSLEDIYYYMAEAYGKCNVTVADLAGKGLTGKIFFATDTMAWGPVIVMATPTPTPTTTPTTTPTPTSTQTPTPTTTPTPSDWQWYLTYGPSGTRDVVKIGTLYVASKGEGAGGASNATKNWDNANSWANNLNWLGRSNWHLPTRDGLAHICANKTLLGSYNVDWHWGLETFSSSAYCSKFTEACVNQGGMRTKRYAVRSVRDDE